MEGMSFRTYDHQEGPVRSIKTDIGNKKATGLMARDELCQQHLSCLRNVSVLVVNKLTQDCQHNYKKKFWKNE